MSSDAEQEKAQNKEEAQEQAGVQNRPRLEEALEVLRTLGLPQAQRNERSALTLLALLGLKGTDKWSAARNPLIGITPMMDFMALHYGKKYAPNSRETIRRQSIHQFLQAGLIIANPDKPDRPINSGKTVYAVEISTLELLRTFGNSEWEQNLAAYLASRDTLQQRYLQEREMQRIPLTLPQGQNITLSPGGQNVLIAVIIKEFAPRFVPGGQVLYIGDADEKFVYFDQEGLSRLGVAIDTHGKMPDVIFYHTHKDWLVLVEAVTSHGPVNPKRRAELKQLFAASTAGLVLVTAFLTRRAMNAYLTEIAWETEVWVADAPSHLIHFNGERFLGPYSQS